MKKLFDVLCPFLGTDNGDVMTELQRIDRKILLSYVRVETAV